MDLSWHSEAACRDLPTDYFFWGEGTVGGATREELTKRAIALATCRSCPVQPQCLDYAIEAVEPAGLWGGLTTRQRRKLRKEREAA